MEENCTHDCSTCKQDCSSRDFHEETNELSHVKHVIGVVSGKGGVGKSLVTSLLATQMKKRGMKTAILDADVTGPSIPKIFGLHEHAKGTDNYLLPVKTKTGINVMSLNLLLESDTEPVIWRGPVIAGTVKQFWTDVLWGDVDYMFVDMPPGTGDVPLTVFQSLPLDGIIIVTSPQDLVSMVVAKAINMARLMNIPVLGLVENYSYLECPDCGKKIPVFGESKAEEISEKYAVPVLAKVPIDPAIAAAIDAGAVENLQGAWLDSVADKIAREMPIED